MKASLPHILLLVADQFRHDIISPAVTPNLYNFQRSNGTTTFPRAYSSTPTCTPARAALLTGKSPWAHGMLSYAQYTSCDKYPTTVPRVLEEKKGYKTVAVGKNHFGPVKHVQGYEEETIYDGLNFYFDNYDQWFNKTLPNTDPKATCGLDWNDWPACPYAFDEFLHPTAWTTRQALQSLNNFFGHDHSPTHSEPLLLKVSYHRPHSPYDPPERLLNQYVVGGSKAFVPQLHRFVNDSSWDMQYKEFPMNPDTWAGNPGAEASLDSRAGYLASAEFVDENIGHLFNYLEKSNLMDKFLIVFVSDHGDMNGDHYLWRKGYAWEGSSHIPMSIRLPQTSTSPARTSSAIVEIRDIAPTVYDYIDVLDEVKAIDPLLDGESLLKILIGQGDSVRQWLDLEHGSLYDNSIHWNALVGYHNHTKCSFWKYIFNANDASEQLFCLSIDEHEVTNLARDKHFSDVLQIWRGRMVQQYVKEKRGREWVREGRLVRRPNSTLFSPHYPCLT